MARKIINPQRPPILWSTLKQAIDDINDNFEDIYTNGIDDSTVPIDLSGVAQDILPDADSIHDIGSASRRWRDIYLSGDSINLGGAIISKTDDNNINIPGLTEKTKFPASVVLNQIPSNGPFPDIPVIIDSLTFTIATDEAFVEDQDYIPTIYSPVLEDGIIVDIIVDQASAYKTDGYVTVDEYVLLNTGPMYALPSDTNIYDYESINIAIQTATLPYGAISATVDTNLSITIPGPSIRNSVQGLQGLQGLQGPTGTQGILGIQGFTGADGLQGSQGNQGIQGRQGIQGTSGAFVGQGIQGNQGIQGIQGAQSVQGIQGNQGIQGIQGNNGNQGVQGIQGTAIQGNQGIQGLNGAFASQGIQGSQGLQGFNGSSAVFSRQNLIATATNLADDATANVDIEGYKGYVLYKVATSHAAWVRIYVDNASRTADSSRLQNEDPLPGAGVIAELISTGAETILFTPAVYGFNNDSPVDTEIYIAITNLSGSTNTITATLTVVQSES